HPSLYQTSPWMVLRCNSLDGPWTQVDLANSLTHSRSDNMAISHGAGIHPPVISLLLRIFGSTVDPQGPGRLASSRVKFWFDIRLSSGWDLILAARVLLAV